MGFSLYLRSAEAAFQISEPASALGFLEGVDGAAEAEVLRRAGKMELGKLGFQYAARDDG